MWCRMYAKALVFALTRSAHDLRKSVRQKIKKIYSAFNGGASIALVLLREFRVLLSKEKVGGEEDSWAECVQH